MEDVIKLMDGFLGLLARSVSGRGVLMADPDEN